MLICVVLYHKYHLEIKKIHKYIRVLDLNVHTVDRMKISLLSDTVFRRSTKRELEFVFS